MKPSDAHALEAGQSAAGHINLDTIAAAGVVVGNRAADMPGRRGLSPTCDDVARLAPLPARRGQARAAFGVQGMPRPAGSLPGASG